VVEVSKTLTIFGLNIELISILVYKCESVLVGLSFFHAAMEPRIDMIFCIDIKVGERYRPVYPEKL